jgi:hypothetical protein
MEVVTQTNALTDGLWFSDDLAFYIDEKGENGPDTWRLVPLIANYETIGMRYLPLLGRWMRSNLCPEEADDETCQGIRSGQMSTRVKWFDLFGDQLIKTCGWHLLWHGRLFTRSAPLSGALEALGWPACGELFCPALAGLGSNC